MIKGKLIELRSIVKSHYHDLQNLLNDKQTMEALTLYFQRDFWTQDQIRKRYEGFAKEEKEGKSRIFVVVDLNSGKIIGNCGFKNIESEKLKAEFGIILHRSCWGKAVALECHFLCLKMAFEEMGLQSIYFTTAITNMRMRGFFEKCKIAQVDVAPGNRLIFEIKAENWNQFKTVYH